MTRGSSFWVAADVSELVLGFDDDVVLVVVGLLLLFRRTVLFAFLDDDFVACFDDRLPPRRARTLRIEKG